MAPFIRIGAGRAPSQHDMGPDPRTYRVKMFLKLGFDLRLAAALADSKDKLGVSVYHEDVKRIIDMAKKQGHDDDVARHLAFGIFSDV